MEMAAEPPNWAQIGDFHEQNHLGTVLGPRGIQVCFMTDPSWGGSCRGFVAMVTKNQGCGTGTGSAHLLCSLPPISLEAKHRGQTKAGINWLQAGSSAKRPTVSWLKIGEKAERLGLRGKSEKKNLPIETGYFRGFTLSAEKILEAQVTGLKVLQPVGCE